MATQLDQYLAPQGQQAPSDPLVDELREEGQQRAVTTALQPTNPDKAGQANQIARRVGMPAATVERNLPTFQDQERAKQWRDATSKYPQLISWLEQPRNAAVAADDVPAITKTAAAHSSWLSTAAHNVGGLAYAGLMDLSRAVTGIASSGVDVARSLLSGIQANGAANPVFPGLVTALQAGINLPAGKPFDRPVDPLAPVVSGLSDYATRQKQLADAYAPSSQNPLVEGLYQGVRSVPAMVAAIGATAAGAPQTGMAIIGGQMYGQSYLDARAAGMSPAKSLTYATSQGAIAAATQDIPLGKYVEEAALPFASRFVRTMAREQVANQVASLAQSFDQWAAIDANHGKSFSDYLAALPGQALQTAVMSAVGSGVAMAGVEGGRALADRVSGTAKANADASALDGIMDAAAESKTRERDPDAFAALMRSLGGTEDSPNVYLPGEVVRSYLQTDGEYDHNFWDRYSDQISESAVTGGDIVIPVDQAVAHLAGTKAWDALRDDARLSPGGPSPREAKAFADNLPETIGRLDEEGSAHYDAAQREAEARGKVEKRVYEQLTNAGMTPDEARTNAALVTAREATRAARAGRELTGNEYSTEIRQPIPEELAGLTVADSLDPVINAMRASRAAKQNRSPSLLEWIVEQGGVEDRGGDIASMGGNEWHLRDKPIVTRDKNGRERTSRTIPFRKKLIRETNPDQPSMLGEDGQANTNSPDELAMRAHEAGYFPEHAERPDVSTFLSAIGDELRGTHRYATEPEGSETERTRRAGEALAQLLEREGLDPAKASDGQIRQAVARYHESEGGGYEQGDGAGPRGRFTPGEKPIIELFQSRNLSTFAHETGHQWLEELRADASASDAPEQVKDDWRAVEKWFKDNGHAIGDDGAIPTDAHEMWARGVERYLMEGKSPSSGLRRVFDTFRSWMLGIYHVVANLRSSISPEIREVMDRLIATDDEIAAAREEDAVKLSFDREQLGMSEAEYTALQQASADARSEAFDALLFRTMAAVRARRTKEYQEQRQGVRDEREADIRSGPVWHAMDMLTDRSNGMALDRQQVIDRYGADALDLIPKRVPPLYKQDGASLDEVAALAGFDSADDLVRSLMGVEKRRQAMREAGDKRSVLNSEIDRETDQVMNDRYGDPLADGSIEREARELIHNDKQGEVIASELRALARRRGRKGDATPYQLAKQWASDKVRQGKVADVASRSAIQQYRRASAKASRAAEKAMLAGDVDEAFRQKRAQMLNNALISEATKAADAVDSAVARMAKIAKHRTLKSVDQDYLERAQALLEQVDLKPRTQRAVDRAEAFAEWTAKQQSAGVDMVVPPSFAEQIGSTHWSRLTVEQLMGLDDATKQIMHLGRKKQELIDGKERREYEDGRGEVMASIESMPKLPTKPNIEPGTLGRAKKLLVGANAMMTKLGRVIDILDGGNSNGPLHRFVWDPLADAQTRERDIMTEVQRRNAESLRLVPREILRRFDEHVKIPEMPGDGGDIVWSRAQLHQMARNAGTEENWRILAEGRGWDPIASFAALDREMTREEWEYVQRDLDTVGSFWPEIKAMYRRINGVEPPKVEARKIVTRHGTFDGGYYPLVPDSTANPKIEQKLQSDDLFSSLATRAVTRNGFTKERTGSTYVVSLAPGISHRHVMEVVHDFTHREALMQADKLLSDPVVVRGMREAIGPELQGQFRPWLKFIANQWAGDRTGVEAGEKIANKLRSNMSIMGMGYRLSTMMQQLGGYANSIEALGSDAEKWMLSGMRSVAGMGPKSAYDFAAERSGLIRHRLKQVDVTQDQELRKLQGKAGIAANVRRFAYYGIGYFDLAVSVPTWHAGYNKAIAEGMDEAAAIRYADGIVDKSQGSAGAMNEAAIQRQKGMPSLLVMFYSYGSAYYNRQAQLFRDTRSALSERRTSDLPRLMARAWWLMIAPNVVQSLVQSAFGGGPRDGENYGTWLALNTVAGAFTGIPFAGGLIQSALSGFDYQASPLDRAGTTIVNATKDIWHSLDDYLPAGVPGADPDGETNASKREVRNAVESVGYITGLPLGQAAPAVQFVTDWANGSAHPETAADWYRGLTTGRTEKR